MISLFSQIFPHDFFSHFFPPKASNNQIQSVQEKVILKTYSKSSHKIPEKVAYR
jgi:hypothetical protein